MNKVSRKRILVFIIPVIILLVIIAAVLSIIRFSEKPDIESSQKDGGGLSSFTEDHRDESEIARKNDDNYTHLDLPEDWQEQMAADAREFAESIDGNIIGEIDSQAQPVGISPETTIIVDKGGYDVVIKGAMILGCPSVSVYDASGKKVAEHDHFLLDQEFRIMNIDIGEYRIVVERYDVEGVNVDCLLKILLELTKPELDLSNKISPSVRKIANPYGVPLVMEYGGESLTIPAKSSSTVGFAEGYNDIVYYLKDENGISEKVDARLNVDTTPPVVELLGIAEKIYSSVEKKVLFNMRMNEYPKYIKVNGKEIDMGTDGEVPYNFAHVEDIEVMSIVVETADGAGNVTKTKLTRDSNMPLIREYYDEYGRLISREHYDEHRRLISREDGPGSE